MSERRRFGRQLVLTVGRVRLEVTAGLRVRFVVQRAFSRTANTARITIYNLAEGTRGQLASETSRLVLEAGYGADGGAGSVGEIFRADTVWVSHHREGADWVTEIQTADGQASLKTPVTVSLKPGARGEDGLEQITEQVRRAMKGKGAVALRQGAVGVQAKRALKSVGFPGGLQLQASADEAYERLLTQAECRWSCEGGAVAIVSPKEALPMPAVKVSPQTGLVGSPRRSRKAGSKQDQLQGVSLLEAGIQPGRRLLVDCASERGVFRVERVIHVGDTHGGDMAWVSRWVAAPLG